jgi:hypothetical protein
MTGTDAYQVDASRWLIGVRATRVQRALVVALATVALSGCGAIVHPTAPFVKSDGLEAGGPAVLGVGPAGATLRFIPSTTFGFGIVLHNTTRQRVTLVDARLVAPPQTLIHQTGTSLRLWNPPPCSGAHSCPGVGFLHAPYAPSTPVGLALRPHDGAGVQLDFRLGSCAEVPTALAAPETQLDVFYRFSDGKLHQQMLPLGSAEPLLRMPKPADCAPRPHSQIAVDGPFASGSTWTIPGSDGDTCTRSRAGGLVFVSRLYQVPDKPMVRVRIVLPHFTGRGFYRTLPQAARADGPAQVTVIVGIGIHGWKPFKAQASVVTATHLTATTIGGRFQATIPGFRRMPFRAYGAWRCTVS